MQNQNLVQKKTKNQTLPSFQHAAVQHLKLAYLISQYPAVSHTFIHREISYLRQLGMDVKVGSINDPDRADADMTAEEVGEKESTYYVKSHGAFGALQAHLHALFFRPVAYVKGLLFALSLATFDVKKTGFNLLYFVEAIMVGYWMEKNDSEHLHVHFATPASTVGMIASQVFSITYSFTVHGPDEFYNTSEYYLTEKIRRAKFICCIGTYARSQMMKLSLPTDWHKFEVSPLGVDLDKFAPRSIETPSERFEILCVGRLVPAKGQHILVQACQKLIAEGRDIHLRFVGDGPDRACLEQAVYNNKLQGRVTFEGAVNQDKIRAFYNQADVFALASFAEGIPVVLMEAMAMEIPCISTKITGIPELIRDGVDGILVAPSDVGALANAISCLMDDFEHRKMVGENGRKRVAQKYHLQNNTQKLAEIFQRCLGDV